MVLPLGMPHKTNLFRGHAGAYLRARLYAALSSDQGEETSSHKPGRGTTRGEWFLRVLETGRGDTYKPPRAHRLSSKSIIALHGLWLLIGSLRSRGPEDRHVANSAGPLSPFYYFWLATSMMSEPAVIVSAYAA